MRKLFQGDENVTKLGIKVSNRTPFFSYLMITCEGGQASVGLRMIRGNPRVVIEEFEAVPQGNGTGREAYTMLEEFIKKHHKNEITLVSEHDKTGFWKRMGFKKFHEDMVFDYMKKCLWERRCTLTLQKCKDVKEGEAQ